MRLGMEEFVFNNRSRSDQTSDLPPPFPTRRLLRDVQRRRSESKLSFFKGFPSFLKRELPIGQQNSWDSTDKEEGSDSNGRSTSSRT